MGFDFVKIRSNSIFGDFPSPANIDFSKAWVIMVSCRLYRSVLFPGRGSENSFCSSLKAPESATSNRSWNSLGSISCRLSTIPPALVIIRIISAFNPSSILGIEIGRNKSVFEPYRMTSAPSQLLWDAMLLSCWYGDKFWNIKATSSTHHPVRWVAGEQPLGSSQVKWRKNGREEQRSSWWWRLQRYSRGQPKPTNWLSGREVNVSTRFFQNWAPIFKRRRKRHLRSFSH